MYNKIKQIKIMKATNYLELVKLELVTMLENGVTLVNIKRHLLNNGCSEKLAITLVRITEINA